MEESGERVVDEGLRAIDKRTIMMVRKFAY